jgi:hypothetical protein
VGKQYVDDEDGFTYQTTRVVVKKVLIVFYRILVQTDGTVTSIEEDNLIFVTDVVRMLSASSKPALVDLLITPQGTIPKGISTTGKRKPVAKFRRTPQLIPKKSFRAKKSFLRLFTLRAIPIRKDKYRSRQKPTTSRVRRLRRQRQLLNVSELSNVGYTVTGNDATFHQSAVNPSDSRL